MVARTQLLHLALAFTLVCGSAAAQPSATDQALGRALFEQGRDAMKAGRIEEACPKLAES
jgi:hypothetical protein